MRKTLAERFMKANDESPVIAGYARGQGGEGAIYRLKDSARWNLNLENCQALHEGYPKWDLPK